MYWTACLSYPDGAVYKAYLNGSNETIVIDSLEKPRGVAIDEAGEENVICHVNRHDVVFVKCSIGHIFCHFVTY